MALISPGVEVTVIDESNYVPAATNSVPYILLATAQNKISGTGTGVAAGTLAANAGKVYLITSQRDLAATFGNPFFYKTSAGTPINGYELNEYGLLAAYSALGISNRAYIQRANVDLAELTATLVRPTGAPADGTWWFDLASTSWGIFQWNQTTGAFTVQTPLVLDDLAQTTGGNFPAPLASLGTVGSYAVVACAPRNQVYYKNSAGVWVLTGSTSWQQAWPTAQGTESITGAVLTGTLVINGVAVAPGGTYSVATLASAINSQSITGVTAAVDSSNRLQIFATSASLPDGSSADGGGIVIDGSSTGSLVTALGLTADSTYYAPTLQTSPNYTVPRWRSTDSQPRPTGSVWYMTTNVNQGASFSFKRFSSALGIFVPVVCPLYDDDAQANAELDPVGGGKNIPAGSLFGHTDPSENNTYATRVLERVESGPTVVTGGTLTPTFSVGNAFTIEASVPGSATMSSPVTVTLSATTATGFVTQFLQAAVPYTTAEITSSGAIAITHTAGGVIWLTDTVGTPIGGTTGCNINPTACFNVRTGVNAGEQILSNWIHTSQNTLEGTDFTYIASTVEPDVDPANGRKWYYSATNQVDIMINDGTTWIGYQNETNDTRGYNLSLTDPAGPIVSASAPTEQSDGSDLEYGDLWVDTSNLELYPVLKRWQNVDGADQWVTVVNSDQTTSDGILFADARWAPNGTTDPITGDIPTITSLLTSDYLDLDAPDATIYPAGMLLWNTRRSGFNVKEFASNYFTPSDFTVSSYSATTAYTVNDVVLYNAAFYVCIAATTGNAPTNTTYWSVLQTNTWKTASGNRNDGSPYMGRQAVRQIVVAAMKSAIDTQDTLREEQIEFNLLACPQYPELIPNMVALNNERSNTGFVIGDTPLRLPPQGADIVAWATNSSGVGTDSETGLVTADAYLGTFYPSCQTTDLSGSQVVQPPSHMMIRTIIRSDEVAFPWLAPAGVRRGVIDNAERIGYINGQTGEFVTIATGQGLRDTLYENRINPITFIPGVGITNYGNKTEAASPSALDRINVARLIAFIRGRLNEIGKTFVFEPNDQITRNEITNAIDGLMIDLVAKRGIYDYLVVCDESNNTPTRIDRNELWVDIAIEPVKAVEFIYIPVRIKNTGEIAAGQVSSSATV